MEKTGMGGEKRNRRVLSRARVELPKLTVEFSKKAVRQNRGFLTKEGGRAAFPHRSKSPHRLEANG